MRSGSILRALKGSLLVLGILVLLVPAASAQKEHRRVDQDPKLNNLVHLPGYKPGPAESLGRVDRIGEGKQAMIMIAGSGFDGEIFTSLAEAYKDTFTSYLVTLAGFSGSLAPPMPPAGTSYSEQTWTRGTQAAVEKLIVEENLKRPIIVGTWLTGTQIALRMALEQPDKIKGAIVISGIPRAPWWLDLESLPSLERRIARQDEEMAPLWFKTVTSDTWLDNNFLPRDFAIHPVRGLQIWRHGTTATLATTIRYFLEVRAQDVTLELPKLKVPVLAVIPGFDEALFSGPDKRDYMRRYCHDSWEGLEEIEELTIETVPDSRVMIMDDKPDELKQVIDRFLSKL